MRRTELTEIHDHPRFPALLRDLVTDALQALWQFGNSYGPVLPLLHEALAAVSARDGGCGDVEPEGNSVEILDLCSGGSGPWLRLAPELERRYGLRTRIRLTDKYPNHNAFSAASERSRGAGLSMPIGSVAEPVDAIAVPQHLAGFRTIFSSFHHFGPAEAAAVLRRAVADGRGIGLFEVARRGPRTMATLCLTPFLLLLLTPIMRPFRWSRLLWTYLVPVVPFVIWYDGLVSCLRAYSLDELRAMLNTVAAETGAGYVWQVGEAETGLLPVTYVIGYPAVVCCESDVVDGSGGRSFEDALQLRPAEALS